jgi:hypothetical protein
LEHSVDRAGRRRDRKFKPPVFGQIQAATPNRANEENIGLPLSIVLGLIRTFSTGGLNRRF